jgi:hypothetical protein
VAAAPVAADGEVTSLRSADSPTYRLKDGQDQTILSASPFNFQNSNGVRQKTDTTLAATSDGSFTPAATGFQGVVAILAR